jgi:hypothetical protein
MTEGERLHGRLCGGAVVAGGALYAYVGGEGGRG